MATLRCTRHDVLARRRTGLQELASCRATSSNSTAPRCDIIVCGVFGVVFCCNEFGPNLLCAGGAAQHGSRYGAPAPRTGFYRRTRHRCNLALRMWQRASVASSDRMKIVHCITHARRALTAGAQQQCKTLYSSAEAGARRARFDRRGAPGASPSSSISTSSAPATVTAGSAASSRARRRPCIPSDPAPARARVGVLYGNRAAGSTHLRHRRQRRLRPCHHPAPAAQRRGLLPPPPHRREHTLRGQIATARTGRHNAV